MELQKFRENFGIEINNCVAIPGFPNEEALNIEKVKNHGIHPYLNTIVELTNIGNVGGLLDSNEVRKHLFYDKSRESRNKKFFHILSLVAEKLSKEANQQLEELFDCLVTLKQYLDLYHQ